MGRLGAYALERGVIWAIIGAIVVATVAAAFSRDRVPLGAALTGAGAVFLGGAVGGAGLVALLRFAHADPEAYYAWLLTLTSIAPPAIVLAHILARLVDVPARDCDLAALAAAVAASLIVTDINDPTAVTTLHAVMVIGGVVAVIVATRYRARRPSGTLAQRGTLHRDA